MAKTIEASVARSLHILRKAEFTKEPTPDRQISPNVFFSWDTSECNVQARVTSQPDEMLRLNATLIGKPRWWCFNIALERGQFSPGDTFGVVAEVEGPADQKIEALIRTRRIKEDGSKDIGDTELKDTIALTGTRSISVLQHVVQSGQHLAGPEAFHTLIMRLPMINMSEMTLFDMHIFHMSGGTQTKTLAGFRT